MLHFNYEKFEFWKVYDSIKQFYPIGVKKDSSRMFHSYPGLKELETIIIENIHNTKKFKSNWEHFTKELKRQVEKPIVGTTYGQAPCFSSYVVLEKAKLKELTRTKELHFFVSLVGPYYSVVGQDKNMLKIEGRHYPSTSYLVVSPENEFAETFSLLCERIEERFTGYRFIPFELCRQTIGGLDVSYSDEHLNTVFHALFNDQVDLNTRAVIGNKYFKSEVWIKEDWVSQGGEWVMYPPAD